MVSSCETLIYQTDGKIRCTPWDRAMDYETVFLDTPDGVMISGWWVPADRERAVVLYCHGNSGNISHSVDILDAFRKMGLSTFIFDYRGFGHSTGKPSESGFILDSETAWKFLVEQKSIAPERIILFGSSMGGAMASRLARKYHPALLILESSFTSLNDVVKDSAPAWFPSEHFVYGMYRTREYIKDVKCPVLIIHSKDDNLISVRHGMALYEAAKGEKDFMVIRGPHGAGFTDHIDFYTGKFSELISKYLN
jgi:alpha-beta hydrolase superfamily lysophospholipase